MSTRAIARPTALKGIETAKMQSFDQFAQAYANFNKASWKNPKHQDQWRNTTATYASPIFGNWPVAQVETALVVRLLSPFVKPRLQLSVAYEPEFSLFWIRLQPVASALVAAEAPNYPREAALHPLAHQLPDQLEHAY